MDVAITAVNKWLYYGWNYPSVPYTYNNGAEDKTRHLPQFIVEVKWTCNMARMVGKWDKAIECSNPNAYLTNFYAELDTRNRQLLIEWVMQNYNDEIKI